MIYPDRAIQELYIENQSVWEEVWAGEFNIYDALAYMGLDPEDPLYDRVLIALRYSEPPL